MYDETVDIWSAGCIIYEIFVGETMFTARSQIGMLIQIWSLFPHLKQLATPENFVGFDLLPNNMGSGEMGQVEDNIASLPRGIKHILVEGTFTFPQERLTAANIQRILEHERYHLQDDLVRDEQDRRGGETDSERDSETDSDES